MTSQVGIALRRAMRSVRSRVFHGGAVMHGPPRPEVALTFDDGPTPEHTPAILDILRQRNARATFFVVGSFLERSPEIGRRILDEQEIACHSYAHDRRVVDDLETFRQDTLRALDVFDRTLGIRPRYYRFPWGHRGRIILLDVHRLFGMQCIHWSGHGRDILEPEDRIVHYISAALEPGAILVLHDGSAPGSIYPGSRVPTVNALPRILDAVQAAGLRPVTVGTLLRGHG
jgi:peptidoglycan-N-acetylglucosamine deacetylase